MATFLDLPQVQGSGYVALAYSNVVLNKDFQLAYSNLMKGLAAFGLHILAQQVVEDIHRASKGEEVKFQLPTLDVKTSTTKSAVPKVD